MNDPLVKGRILAIASALLLVLSQLIWFLPVRADAETAGDELVVRVQYYGELGDKIREKARFSRAELEAMGSSTWYYSNITRVGTVMSMAAYGPEVMTVIEAAGIDPGSIQNVTFRTTDGYTRNFTVERHLTAEKYYYPNLASCYERNEDGNALTPTDGALDGMQTVPAILALEFGESKKAGVHAENLELSRDRTYRFCMGQSLLEEGVMTDPTDGGGDISSMESCHSIYGIDVTLAGSPIRGLELDLDDTTIKVGSMKRVSASFIVEEAFEGAFSGEDLKWSSSDDSIASVNSRGEVTVHKPGKVTITATAPDGTSAQIVINGAGDPGKKKDSSKDTGKASSQDNSNKDKTSTSNTGKKDTSKPSRDKSKTTATASSDAAKPVTLNAREIVLGDTVEETVSPQEMMRSSMADDAVALNEARTYSRGAAAGTAAGAGILCGAGALGRVRRYRRDFRVISKTTRR